MLSESTSLRRSSPMKDSSQKKSLLNTQVDVPPWMKKKSAEASTTIPEEEEESSDEEEFPEDGKSKKKKLGKSKYRMTFSQSIAYLASHLLALSAIAVVTVWTHNVSMGGGGLSWKDGEPQKVFNWHPLCMIYAFAFMTVASLAFRIPSTKNRHAAYKLIHGVTWLISAFFAAFGIYAVYKSHNDPTKYIANFYSLHSWIGVLVIMLFTLQFVVGLSAFGLNLTCGLLRENILATHRFFGPLIYNMAASNILLGIQEKEGFIGCAYTVESADRIPFQNVHLIPQVCHVGHALGILVFLLTVSTNYALYNFPNRHDEKNT